nr:MAG: coat protein [Leviviridae sp.]
MSAFANITLGDRTPTNVVFGPAGIDSSGVAKFLVAADASYDAKRSLTMSVALPKNGSNVVRVKQKVMIPIMDAVDSSLKVAEAYVTMEAVIPKQASLAQRQDLKAFAKNFLLDAVTTAAYENFEAIY